MSDKTWIGCMRFGAVRMVVERVVHARLPLSIDVGLEDIHRQAMK